MNKAPKIYADWVKVFNILKSGEDDENILALMQEGIVVWQSGVAERFFKKISRYSQFQIK